MWIRNPLHSLKFQISRLASSKEFLDIQPTTECIFSKKKMLLTFLELGSLNLIKLWSWTMRLSASLPFCLMVWLHFSEKQLINCSHWSSCYCLNDTLALADYSYWAVYIKKLRNVSFLFLRHFLFEYKK